jgi:sterol desaturase/sphingolipid hydroxylase (fatty acid hydroxylase superfamily)
VFDPGTIFYLPYILCAFAIVLVSQRRALRPVSERIFSRRVWLTRSTWLDLQYTLIFLLVMRAAAATVESATFQGALTSVGDKLANLKFTGYSPGVWVEAAVATAATMIAIDFASYATHRLLHAWTPFWEIHAVHHSAEYLTPLTTYRQHPIEPLVLNGARGLCSGIALAAVHTVFPNQTPVITIFGLGAGFFIYMLTVNLHHFPVTVRYPRWIRAVLISPHLHHIHHSRDERHQFKNFGVVFSFWDRMLGTYCDEETELVFGLGATEDREWHGHPLLRTLVEPLARAGKALPSAAAAVGFGFLLGLIGLFFSPGAALGLAIGFLGFHVFAGDGQLFRVFGADFVRLRDDGQTENEGANQSS